MPQQLRSPRRQTLVRRHVLDRLGFAGSDRGTDDAVSKRVLGPADTDLLEVTGPGTGPCGWTHGLDRVVLGDADPGQAIPAALDDHAAHLVQQFRLGGRADQNLVAAAQRVQRAVQAPERDLGQLALGDVDEAGAQQSGVGRWQPNQPDLANKLLPLGIANGPLENHLLLVQCLLVVVPVALLDRAPVGLVGEVELQRPEPDELVATDTEQFLGVPIGRYDPVLIGVVEQDRLGRLLDQQAEPLLALPEVFFRAFLLADVDRDADDGRLAAVRRQRALRQHIDAAAALPFDGRADLHRPRHAGCQLLE